MYTHDSALKKGELSPFTIRISASAKEALFRRAGLRSERENRTISPRQVARELLEYAIALMDENNEPAANEQLADEVMVAAFFARRAFEIILSTHDGLAEKLLRASRAEVRRRKLQRSNGGST